MLLIWQKQLKCQKQVLSRATGSIIQSYESLILSRDALILFGGRCRVIWDRGWTSKVLLENATSVLLHHVIPGTGPLSGNLKGAVC